MDDSLVLLHLAIAIVGIVVLIVAGRLNPVVVLVIGALYLGVAGGLGFEGTTTAVTDGFGSLMAEIGLIIGFGVLLGTLLADTGTLQRIVALMLRAFGVRRSSYALGLASGIVFPSIYFDVALVMLAPIARTAALRGRTSIAPLAGALAIGLEVGLLFVLPGAAALAVAGTLDVPLGQMLLLGIPFGIVAVVVSVWLHTQLMRRTWNPDRDEDRFAEEDQPDELAGSGGGSAPARTPGRSVDGDGAPGGTAVLERPALPSLPLAIAPVLVPLVLILVATLTTAAGAEVGLLGFLGNPVVALLIGVLVAMAVARPVIGREGVESSLVRGAGVSGSILLFNGVAGSLGGVIAQVGVADLVAGLFTASPAAPLLLTWLVAALLRLAQGSGSVAAITAASLLAPIVGDTGTAVVLIAFAAAAGASFGGNVSDNSFWMFKTLLRLSTRGSFQVYTVAQSILSVVALGMVLLLSLVL